MHTGKIKAVYKNHGIINCEVDDHSVNVLFFIFPDMKQKSKLKFTDEVKFDLETTQIRGERMYLATNIKQITDKNPRLIKSTRIYRNDIVNYHEFIYKNFYKIDDSDVLKEVIHKDKILKEVVLKWVLFLEEKIKLLLVDTCSKFEIDQKLIYNVLKNDPLTRTIHKNIFKTLRTKYMFRTEFNLLEIDRSKNGDRKTCEIISAPFILYLENLTLDELGKILSSLNSNIFDKYFKDDQNINFLFRIQENFLELSLIRNAAAHGNPFIPLILDNDFSPNYLFDLTSPFPQFNSGEIVDKWSLFEPLRFTTRQLVKQGIAPFYKGGLQYTGLYTAKYILINPARRSFFSFLFVLEYHFKFIDGEDRDEFVSNINEVINIFDDNTDSFENGALSIYPKENPVIKQISSIIYPMYMGEFFWISASKLSSTTPVN